MPEYRQALIQSLFFKFYIRVAQKLGLSDLDPRITNIERSPRPSSHGLQEFQVQKDLKYVSHPHLHLSALKQTTGEAEYVDDLRPLQGECYGVLVFSKAAHAKIKSINYEEALKITGVIGWIDKNDVHHNQIGSVVHDEFVFADGIVTSQGQPIGMIIAENQSIARRAAKLVSTSYENLPPIITIDDAIKANSFFEPVKHLSKGNVDEAMESCAHTIEGIVRMGGQEHFYLETNAAIVKPGKEENEIEIIASTQNPTELQHLVAEVLGIPANRVTCKVRRFNEIRQSALAVDLVEKKADRVFYQPR